MNLGRRWTLVVAELGWPSIVALALTSVVGIVSWILLILDGEPAWSEFMAIHLITIVVANTLVSTLLLLSPFSKNTEKGTRMTFLVILSPVLLTALVAAVITPPSLPMDGFLEGAPPLGVIALIALLGLGATLCGLLVYFAIVFPVVLLVRAIRPETSRTASSVMYEGMSRRQLVTLAIAIPTLVTLVVFLSNVSDRGTSRGSRRRADLDELFTLTGEPWAIIGVVVCAAVLITAIVIAARPQRSTT